MRSVGFLIAYRDPRAWMIPRWAQSELRASEFDPVLEGQAPKLLARQRRPLRVALDAYRLDNGRYPTTEQGLNALWEKPAIDPPANWRAPYLRKPVPLDPWGHAYVYAAPGVANPNAYDLYTLGKDGKPGGSGEDADITSWNGPVR